MLIWLGAGMQFLGLLLLFIGFVTTWHDYGDGRNFFEFIAGSAWARIKRTAIGLWAALPWRSPQAPRPVTTKDTLGVAIEEEAGLSAGAQVWPDPASDPGLFAARVQGMFAEFDRRVSAQEHALKAELREREQGDKELRGALNREVNRLNKKAHGVATDGLRWEFAGWIFLVAGLIVSTIGAGSANPSVQTEAVNGEIIEVSEGWHPSPHHPEPSSPSCLS